MSLPRVPYTSPTASVVFDRESANALLLEDTFTSANIDGVDGRIDVSIPANLQTQREPQVRAMPLGLSGGLVPVVSREVLIMSGLLVSGVRLRIQDGAGNNLNGIEVQVTLRTKYD
jgi:hypothetical protein